MSQFQDGPDITLVSDWDLSALQYRLVKTSAQRGHAAIVTSQANDPIIGVLQNKPTSGAAARVRIYGTSKVQVTGTVSYGDILKAAGANGFAITGNSGYLVGFALETVASGGLCEVLVQPNQATA